LAANSKAIRARFTSASVARTHSHGAWHHVKWEFERTADAHSLFIALTVDGVRQIVNKYQTPQGSRTRELNIAFQMDGKGTMIDYNAWSDKARLTVW